MSDIKAVISILAVSALLVTGLTLLTNYEPAGPELITGEDGEPETFTGPYVDEKEVTLNLEPIEKVSENNPIAVLTTSEGVIEVELFVDMMPITTDNFIKLANQDFYDNTKFHRVMENFMIQGGDPNTKTDNTSSYGQGGPGYTIQDEFVAGELLTNVPGTIAMANTGQPNSGGSQFFINVSDNKRLDWNVPDENNSAHPVFGRVINGMDVVYAISKVETGSGNIPTEPVIIESIEII